jgi:hypothetical protein
VVENATADDFLQSPGQQVPRDLQLLLEIAEPGRASKGRRRIIKLPESPMTLTAAIGAS